MRATFRSCCIFLGLAAASLVAAQEPPPDDSAPDESEILVEGQRIVDFGAASDLARDVARRPRSTVPMARLTAPLCLQLAIDNEAKGRLIGRRIIANARAANIAIAEVGCRPNALVIIADNMRAKIDEYRRDGRRFFGSLKRHQIDRALRVRDPVYVFHDVVFKTNTRGGIDRKTRMNLMTTAVMIDSQASSGFSAHQVADYASLRLLAPSRELAELENSGARTIMTLFADPSQAPPEMTRLDRSYLVTLYRLPSRASAVDVLLETSRVLLEDGVQGP